LHINFPIEPIGAIINHDLEDVKLGKAGLWGWKAVGKAEGWKKAGGGPK
jgi:hypothetical protein